MPKKLITDKEKSYFKKLTLPFLDKCRVQNPSLLYTEDEYCPVTNTYPRVLGLLWDNYKGYTDSVESKLTQGMINTYLSFFAETNLDDLPSGSVGYFLGRRRTQIKYINTVFKSRGWILERKDPSKATFFIVGDILTKEDNNLNRGLSKPIVMDMTLDDEYNCLFADVSNLEVNEHRLFSLFTDPNLEKLHTLVNLLKYVNPRKLSSNMRVRILMYYIQCVGKRGYSYFDLKHKHLIKEMKRLALPYHQFFLEPKFANLKLTLDHRISLMNPEIMLEGGSHWQNNVKGNAPGFGELGVKEHYTYSYGGFKATIPLDDTCKDLFMDSLNNNLSLCNALQDLVSKKTTSIISNKNDYYYSKFEFLQTFTSGSSTSSWTKSKYDSLKYNCNLLDVSIKISIDLLQNTSMSTVHNVNIRAPHVGSRNGSISVESVDPKSVSLISLDSVEKNPLKSRIGYIDYLTIENLKKLKTFINGPILETYAKTSKEYSDINDKKLTSDFRDLVLECILFPFMKAQKMEKELVIFKQVLDQIQIT